MFLFLSFLLKRWTITKELQFQIAIVTIAALLTLFAVAGSQILTIFGITIYSFMVAGGVSLFIVSIEPLTHGVWRFGIGTRREIGESGVVSLVFPLLAGPGAITSVMISFQTGGLIVTMLSISIVIVITYIILRVVNTWKTWFYDIY